MLVEIADVMNGLTEDFHQFIIGALCTFANVFLADSHPFRAEFELIKSLRIFTHSLIFAPPHILQDALNCLFDTLLYLVGGEQCIHVA